jgi:hypothetical protein
MTKTPKSNKSVGRDFHHVLSTEFLTKEEIEKTEKMVMKKKSIAISSRKHLNLEEFHEDPKIVSTKSKIIFDDDQSHQMTFLRDSMPDNTKRLEMSD